MDIKKVPKKFLIAGYVGSLYSVRLTINFFVITSSMAIH